MTAAFAGLVLTVTPAHAAVVQTIQVDDSNTAFDAGVSTSLTSLATVTASTPTGGSAAGLSDGIGAEDLANAMYFRRLDTSFATITFNLDQAYDLTSISSLTGWGGAYFGSQIFTVSIETGSSGTFNQLVNPLVSNPVGAGNFGTTPYLAPGAAGFPVVADDAFAVLTTITDDSGIIASNVTGVRFEFFDPYPSIGSLNGTVIRELSITGSAVPEPSTCSLMAGVFALGVFIRRRK